MVLPYLKGSFYILGVVHGECFGSLDVQGCISEVKGYIISYIFEVLLREVLQGTCEVILGQGKYVMEILKRFLMIECKPLATPMVLNLNLHYIFDVLLQEVLQRTCEVILGQGKYVMEILKRFSMTNYKPLATPMVLNLNLHADLDSDLVDPSIYKQLISSLMYLVNAKPNMYYVFYNKHFDPVHG
jgi:hypothetical protein